MGFPRKQIYVSFSGGKGYHVEMFFNEIVSTESLKRIYDAVIEAEGLNQHKVEFRPKYRAAIKLPLSIHAKTGHICWFVDRETFDPITREDYLLQIQPLTVDVLTQACEKCPSPKEAESVGKKTKETTEHSDPVPANQIYGTRLTEKGTRHNVMRNIVVYLRTHGVEEDACREELHRWLDAQDPSLIGSSPEEIQTDIELLVSWAYSPEFITKKAQSIDQTTICASQMKEVLRQSNRSSRR